MHSRSFPELVFHRSTWGGEYGENLLAVFLEG